MIWYVDSEGRVSWIRPVVLHITIGPCYSVCRDMTIHSESLTIEDIKEIFSDLFYNLRYQQRQITS